MFMREKALAVGIAIFALLATAQVSEGCWLLHCRCKHHGRGAAGYSAPQNTYSAPEARFTVSEWIGLIERIRPGTIPGTNPGPAADYKAIEEKVAALAVVDARHTEDIQSLVRSQAEIANALDDRIDAIKGGGSNQEIMARFDSLEATFRKERIDGELALEKRLKASNTEEFEPKKKSAPKKAAAKKAEPKKAKPDKTVPK